MAVARTTVCLPAFVHVLSDVQILNIHVSVGELVIAIQRKKKKKKKKAPKRRTGKYNLRLSYHTAAPQVATVVPQGLAVTSIENDLPTPIFIWWPLFLPVLCALAFIESSCEHCICLSTNAPLQQSAEWEPTGFHHKVRRFSHQIGR